MSFALFCSIFKILTSTSYLILALPCRRLGWEPKPGESHLDAMLRGEILTALAVFGHDLTLEEASKRFQAFLENRNTPLLPPDIRKVGWIYILMHDISLWTLLLIISMKCCRQHM